MRKNVTLKKFKDLNKKPEPLRKGITYSIEKVSDSNNFIVKKYVNGKLFKQKIISDKKLKSLVQKQIKKSKNKTEKRRTSKKGGTAEQVQKQPIQVQVQPQSLWQTFKEGAVFGLAWELVETLFDSIFDSIFDS
jgi:hypothetical protein